MKEEIRKKLMENSKENYPRIKEEMKDMLTLEERAKINATKAIEYACGRRVGEPDYITHLFIQMASEQKAIDIERMISYVEDMPQDVTRQDIIDGLTKAMEEELCTTT